MGRITRLLLVTIFVAGATMTAAQTRDTAAEAQQIFTSVMSPFCPGLLLADCPSPAAFDLRVDIRRRLDAGESRADIERALLHQYGDAIRAVPEPQGWGRVLWVTPAIVLALSLAGLAWFLKRHVADAPSGEPERDPVMESRLDQELDDLP